MPETQQLNTVNQMSREAFTDVLGDIFEHSAWIANAAWEARPFSTIAELHQAMFTIVQSSSVTQKMDLLCAHPELAGKVAQQGQLTDSSTEEQKGAGLSNLSSEEMTRIGELNQAYAEKFAFPFIIAVKNHNKHSIFSEFERRLANSREDELKTALEQVGLIAEFRLQALFDEQ